MSLSRWWTWLSLILAFLGALSLFNDLLPNLVRLSLIVKGIVAAYRLAREEAYDWLQHGFALLNIQIPELPLWLKDIGVVGLLLFAALNIESHRRFRAGLLGSYVSDLAGNWRSVFSSAPERPSDNFYRRPAKLTAPLADSIYYYAALQVFIVLLVIGLAANGAFDHLERIHWSIGLAAGCAIGLIVWAIDQFALPFLWRCSGEYNRGPANFREFAARLGYTLFWTLIDPILSSILAVRNGWRSVAGVLAILFVLWGLNEVFLRVVDPMLLHPPGWLVRLIEADPHSLNSQ